MLQTYATPTLLFIGSIVVSLLAFYIHRLETKVKFLRRVRQLESTLPVGTKFYYDHWTGRGCLRCKKGKIATRERYQTSLGENGKLVLGALPRVHWCDGCSYRNTSLEIEEEIDLT